MVIVQLLQQRPILLKRPGSSSFSSAQKVRVAECEQVFSLSSPIQQLDGKFVACRKQVLRATIPELLSAS